MGQKVRPQTHGYNSVKSQSTYKIVFAGRFFGKFAVKWLLTIPPVLRLLAVHVLACNFVKYSPIFNNRRTANLPRNLPVKTALKIG